MIRYRRRAEMSETAVDDELFLAHPETQEIVHLDPLAAALWRLLAEPHTTAEIEAAFAAAFPTVPPDRLGADLQEALATLLAAEAGAAEGGGGGAAP